MIIVLVRHAPAEGHGEAEADAMRQLTDNGRAKMKKAAAGLAVMLAKETDFCLITSPLIRAVQTAEIVSDYLQLKCFNKDDRLIEGQHEDLIQLIHEHSHEQVLLLTGHEPWISSFSEFLSRQELPYRKGAAAAFRLEDGWEESGADLLWFMQPIALRRLSVAHKFIQKDDE